MPSSRAGARTWADPAAGVQTHAARPAHAPGGRHCRFGGGIGLPRHQTGRRFSAAPARGVCRPHACRRLPAASRAWRAAQNRTAAVQRRACPGRVPPSRLPAVACGLPRMARGTKQDGGGSAPRLPGACAALTPAGGCLRSPAHGARHKTGRRSIVRRPKGSLSPFASWHRRAGGHGRFRGDVFGKGIGLGPGAGDPRCSRTCRRWRWCI